jgi:hypothetical protein
MYTFTIHIQSSINKRFVVVVKEIGITSTFSTTFFRGIFGRIGLHITDIEYPLLYTTQNEIIHTRHFDAERMRTQDICPLHMRSLCQEFGLNILLYTIRPRLIILGFYQTIQHTYRISKNPSCFSIEQAYELQEDCLYEEVQSFVELCANHRDTLDVNLPTWEEQIYLFTKRICMIINTPNSDVQTCEQRI